MAVVAALLLACVLAGCGKKTDGEAFSSEEPVEESDAIFEIENTDYNIDWDSIVDITKVPKEEWPDLTWEQIRDFTLVFLPGFREVYGIPQSAELGMEEWEEIKGFMFYQLFGQIYAQYVKVGEVYDDVEIVEDTSGYGEDWIYFEPTKEYLESLNPDEIAAYFQAFYPTVFGVTPTDKEGNEIRFRDYTDEELLNAMRIFVEKQF